MTHAESRDEGVGLWSNWYGNITCQPARRISVASEEELLTALANAGEQGMGVRPVGSGHSNTPLAVTDGALISLEQMRGIIEIDASGKSVTAWAGTVLKELVTALWQEGLALENQGDIDGQALAGVVSTATHGTGVKLHSFSGQMSGATLATSSLELMKLSAQRDRETFRAARVGLGALGVMTRVTLPVLDAYCLHERWYTMAFEEALEQWETLLRGHRHCAFCWNPTATSAELWGRPAAPADSVSVRIMDPVDGATAPFDAGAERVDRSYRVFAHEYEPEFAEMEYEVPVEDGPAALRALRSLVARRWPGTKYPIDVRFAAADDGYLSPSQGGATAILAPCGVWCQDPLPFLKDCHDALSEFVARPHWGKLSSLDAKEVDERFRGVDAFRKVRQRLDPAKMFLNPYLRELLGT